MWKKLFKTRWSGVTDQIEPVDWQQRYWEAHVQGYVHLISSKHSVGLLCPDFYHFIALLY